MAKDSIFTLVLLGGAAYLAWNWLMSQPAAAAAPATGGSAPPPAPTVAYVPPTVTQQLQTAAGAGVTMLNADQWAYYWNQIGKPAVDGTKWTNIFFPNGRPGAGQTAPTITAAAYVAALNGAGISGYRQGMGAFAFPVPILVSGRGFGQFTLGDLRKAGGR